MTTDEEIIAAIHQETDWDGHHSLNDLLKAISLARADERSKLDAQLREALQWHYDKGRQDERAAIHDLIEQASTCPDCKAKAKPLCIQVLSLLNLLDARSPPSPHSLKNGKRPNGGEEDLRSSGDTSSSTQQDEQARPLEGRTCDQVDNNASKSASNKRDGSPAANRPQRSSPSLEGASDTSEDAGAPHPVDTEGTAGLRRDGNPVPSSIHAESRAANAIQTVNAVRSDAPVSAHAPSPVPTFICPHGCGWSTTEPHGGPFVYQHHHMIGNCKRAPEVKAA